MDASELRDFVLGTSALQPGEKPIAHMRPSKRLFWGEVIQTIALIGPTILLSSLLAGGPAPPEFGASPFAFLTFGTGAVFFEILFLGPRVVRAWIHVRFTEYVLTNDRIYSRTEFLSTDLRVVPYERVMMLVVRRNLMECMLGIAQIHVRAYGDEEQHLRLRGLRDPWPLFLRTREALRSHNTAAAIIRSD